jgi:hypothetical protein
MASVLRRLFFRLLIYLSRYAMKFCNVFHQLRHLVTYSPYAESKKVQEPFLSLRKNMYNRLSKWYCLDQLYEGIIKSYPCWMDSYCRYPWKYLFMSVWIVYGMYLYIYVFVHLCKCIKCCISKPSLEAGSCYKHQWSCILRADSFSVFIIPHPLSLASSHACM